MKQAVVPGGTIDAATTAEVAELVQALVRVDVYERVRESATGDLDANGDGVVQCYKVPVGMEFRLCRVLVTAAGYSYAAMFTNAAGGVTIERNGDVIIDGYNLAAGIPNAWSAGSGAAPRYKNGEMVTVRFVGGPPDTGVLVRIEGDQFPKGGES